MAETPKRYIRVDDQRWHAGQAKAADEGTTLTKLFNDWLDDYINGVSPIPRIIVGAELDETIHRLLVLRSVVMQQKGLQR